MRNEKQLLLADIGGTNARFAIGDRYGGFDHVKILRCDDFVGPVDAALHYLDQIGVDHSQIDAARFAVAAPMTETDFKMTNNHWKISQKQIIDGLSLSDFKMMNDFAAQALAIPNIEPKDLHMIRKGRHYESMPIAVIGCGTGLGVETLVWGDGRYNVASGEGGHVTLAAQNDRQYSLIKHIAEKGDGHVSAEKICSGPGLVTLYKAICALDSKKMLPDYTPEEITTLALNNECPVCRETLDLMMAFLGSVAGNLALTIGAKSGLYIGGGIVPQLGHYIETGPFLKAFQSKGRFTEYLSEIPVFVIRHEFPAFIGLQSDDMG